MHPPRCSGRFGRRMSSERGTEQGRPGGAKELDVQERGLKEQAVKKQAAKKQGSKNSAAQHLGGVQETLRETSTRLRERLLHKFWVKLGAFLLAVIFWFFVSTDDALLAQRTLRAPLHTEGLTDTQTVPGLPDRVTVRLSGPSSRLSALNPDGIDVVLNLRGVTGEFGRDVRVFPPQGITVVRVSPNEIIGSVETRVQKEVPVQVVTLGAPTADTVLETQADSATVQVEGTAAQLERVTQVLAPYTADTDTQIADTEVATTRVKLYAADAEGEPVAGVSITPEEVSVSAESRAVFSTRTLPLELTSVTVAGLEVVSATPTQAEVTVVGPEEVLKELSGVTASLPETSALGPGRYTLGLTLALPDGVTALQVPQLELDVRAPR